LLASFWSKAIFQRGSWRGYKLDVKRYGNLLKGFSLYNRANGWSFYIFITAKGPCPFAEKILQFLKKRNELENF